MDFWLMRRKPPRTPDIDGLEWEVMSAIRMAADDLDVGTNSDHFDAIVLLLPGSTVLDGWEETAVHRKAILGLGISQIEKAGQNAFINRTPLERLTDVLADAVNDTEVDKCKTALHIAIRMMRSAVLGAIPRMTAQSTRPTTREAVVQHITTLTAGDFFTAFRPEVQSIADFVGTIGETSRPRVRDNGLLSPDSMVMELDEEETL